MDKYGTNMAYDFDKVQKAIIAIRKEMNQRNFIFEQSHCNSVLRDYIYRFLREHKTDYDVDYEDINLIFDILTCVKPYDIDNMLNKHESFLKS